MLEYLIFTITLVSFVVPIVFAITRPLPFQIDASNYAEKNGWNKYIILIVRSCPYLTTYSQFWFLVAIYDRGPTAIFVGLSFAWGILILYHSINFINPMHLSYHPEEIVLKVTGLKPPNDKLVVIWCGLHLQHTFPVMYLHYLAYSRDINYQHNYSAFFVSMLLVAFYIVWHLFCWRVQGIPAYPFLKHFRQENMLNPRHAEIIFYYAGFLAVIVLNCVLGSMWGELLFYVIGLAVSVIGGLLITESKLLEDFWTWINKKSDSKVVYQEKTVSSEEAAQAVQYFLRYRA
jgi:hypothetical protein